MRKLVNILMIIALVMTSCKKDKDFSGVVVELSNEKITKYENEISYYVEYTYPAKLKSVKMEMSDNSLMSNSTKTVCETGYTSIRATVSNLNQYVTYYYKLIYDTGYGTLESDVRNFMIADPGDGTPVVKTHSITDITQTSAKCIASVQYDGGYFVTVRGACWSTSHNPTVNDAHNTNYYDTGSYEVVMPALTTKTKYYVRAYAKNEKGINYGNELNFTTN